MGLGGESASCVGGGLYYGEREIQYACGILVSGIGETVVRF